MSLQQAVAGYLLNPARSIDDLDRVLDLLDDSWFTDDDLLTILHSAKRLRGDGEWVDATTVMLDAHRHHERLDPTYLVAAEEACPPPAAIDSYIRNLGDERASRLARQALTDGLAQLTAGDTPGDVLRDVEVALEATTTERLWSRDEYMAAEALDRLREDHGIGKYKTGLGDLDIILGTLRPKCVYLVVGQSGDGKTALGVQMAVSLANQGARVDFYSTEMDGPDLFLRALACTSGIDSRRLERWACGAEGLHNGEDMGANGAWHEWQRDRNLRVIYRPGLRASDVLHRSQVGARTRGKADVIIVDYVQRLRAEEGDEPQPRNVQVGTMSSVLKDASMVLDCPVIVLCQPNRAWLSSGQMTPGMEHLGESSRLEKDADVILSIGYPYRRHKEADALRGKMAIRVVKNRRGPPGWLWASYRPECSRIRTLPQTEWPGREAE